METPAFKLIEDKLRIFFGRACKELTTHHADPLDRFIRPPFSKIKGRKPPTSLESLEYSEYARILWWNTSADLQEGVSRLFGRYTLPSLALASEIRYCGALRHKYAHLKGVGEAVTRREQLADIIILRRVVGAIAGLTAMDDFDREILSMLDEIAEKLLGEIAASHSTAPSDDQVLVDWDLLSARLVGDLLAALAQREASGSSVPGDGIDAILVALAEMRLDLVSLQKRMAEPRNLNGRLDAILESLSHLHSPSAGVAELHHADSQPTSDGTDHDSAEEGVDAPAFEWDLADVSAALALPPTAMNRRKHRPRLLSWDEAREELVALRSRMWAELGSGPSSDGLLRKRMLEAFLEHRPASEEELEAGPIGGLLSTVDPDQREYLPDVLSIVSRIEA